MSKSIADVNRERKEEHGTMENTVDMFPVGARVKVICVAQDFYFFEDNETGVVTKAGDDTVSGMVIVKFDKPRHFEGGYVQEDFNFDPDDLVLLGKPETRCPHCSRLLTLGKATA